MISTSFILSTGLKKWMPMNFPGRALAWARPVIGRVEVLLAKKPPGASCGSAARVAWALSARFSNTASMISSQPARSPTSAVVVMRASRACCACGVMRPWPTRASPTPALHPFRPAARRREPGAVGFAGVGLFQAQVLQDGGNATAGLGPGDARAHHAGAKDADLG